MDGMAAPLSGSSAHLTITPRLRRQLAEWLQEDLGRGDLSAVALQGRRVCIDAKAGWLVAA